MRTRGCIVTLALWFVAGLAAEANPPGVRLWINDWKLCSGIKGRNPLQPIFSERENQVAQLKVSRRHRLHFWTRLAGNLEAAESIKGQPIMIVHQWLKNIGGGWENYRELAGGKISNTEAMVWEASENGQFDWRADTNLAPPEVGYYRVAVGVRFGTDDRLEELTRFDIEVIE